MHMGPGSSRSKGQFSSSSCAQMSISCATHAYGFLYIHSVTEARQSLFPLKEIRRLLIRMKTRPEGTGTTHIGTRAQSEAAQLGQS